MRIVLLLLALGCAPLLAAGAQPASPSGPAAAAASVEAVVQSPRDTRGYRYLRLANRLRALLVSDPDTDMAGAALDIDIGSQDEPDERPGLAHFLEHMLFLGTQKYPEPGAYQQFIQAHGGEHNASTAYGHTNYYFDVEHGHLFAALDRFAQFFVAPLFDAAYVDRERHAVDSEFQARLKSDESRSWEATKQILNPAHPISRFTVGSLSTLSDGTTGRITDALGEFWRTHYSANRMTLVVYGAEPLDQLEAQVRELFSAIPDRDRPATRIEAPLFAPGALPKLLRVESVRDVRILSFSFPIPSPEPYFETKPTHLIANLVGHEGAGSLLSALKARGLADALSSGLGLETSDAALFQITVRLTEEGLARLPEVTGQVFAYLQLLRREGVARWRFAEEQRLLELAFEFQDRAAPIRYAVGLARAMHDYPPAETLRGPFRLSRFDAPLIADYLARLRPDNVLITLLARGQETDRVSPYYDTPYAVESLPASIADSDPASTSAMRLPDQNPFLPESLDLEAVQGQAVPVRFRADPGLSVWFAPDISYGVPKANVFVSVRSPVANDSPRHAMLTNLYIRLVTDQLQEFTYPARLAGLGYDLYPHQRGFTLRVMGYDDKIPLLLERVTATLANPTIDAARFAIEKDDLGRDLENRAKDRSFRIAMRRLSALLLEPNWLDAEELEALRALEPADLSPFIPQLLSALDVVALVHGNASLADAAAVGQTLNRHLVAPARAVTVPRGKVVKLPPGSRYRSRLEVEHRDSGIDMYFQGRSRLLLEMARFSLLGQIISAPFYTELRTQQQLGYVVFAGPANLIDVPGLGFVIQSPGTPPPELEQRIRAFVAGFAQTLESMPPATFERHRAGLLARILEQDRTLGDRAERYWQEIDRERLTFDTQARLAEAVRGVRQETIPAFYRTVLTGETHREISVHAVGAAHLEADRSAPPIGVQSVDDPRAFKHHQQFFP